MNNIVEQFVCCQKVYESIFEYLGTPDYAEYALNFYRLTLVFEQMHVS